MTDERKTTSAWEHIGRAACWIVFVLCCFAYCMRKEITEVLK